MHIRFNNFEERYKVKVTEYLRCKIKSLFVKKLLNFIKITESHDFDNISQGH